MKKNKLFHVAQLLTALLLCSLSASAQRNAGFDETQIRKMIYSQSAIKQLYVDTVNESKLVEDAIRGMLKELDPHSQYTPAKDVQALNEPLQGSFEGIGVQYNINEDTLVVIQPTSGGPSEKVGIIAGDKIVTVNDTAIAGVKMSRAETMKRLRGPKGTKVKLGVIRQGVPGVQTFIVTRDKIPLYTIDAAYMIDDKTGYIRISSFGQTTHAEFVRAATDLISQGMKNIVIDLQGNGGGFLQSAVELSDEFLSNGEMIVYTEGRTTGRHEYHAEAGKMNIDKIVILVDGYTASAAEILSGAIQDNDKGIIVGRRTFGKGLVQRPIDLPDGSLIRLTIAHYYSPVGRCFQKPYVKGDRKSYDNDMMERLNSGELMSADSIHFPDSLKYTTKGGRIVYGGGGIMPDVYVPLDTTIYTRLYRELAAKSCIIQATLRYLEKYRKPLIKQYNIEAYRKAKAKKIENKQYDPADMIEGFGRYKDGFEVPQELIDLTLERAKEAKIQYTDSMLQATMPVLRIQLKALLARDLWDMNEYFQIVNPSLEIYRQGLKAIKEE
ncbi:MAG: S41 family peptidase [Bacteroidaceae bacterium]|nr:S41 family peptidase [Bacteroidaceae bacterium]MBQ4380287.1 S41 family peptidase [Bacteroidaceae bacterium]